LNVGTTPIRVYFLGSGGLGVPVLRQLAAAQDMVLVGVGTQPDREQGRQRHLSPTAIGQAATALGRDADRLATVSAPEFLQRLNALTLDLVVVVAFGQILKKDLLALPRCGCLNVHASLLPRHRGASPVQAAILAGDAETGVTFMRMDEGLDTGPVYEQVHLRLTGTETASALAAALADLAATGLPDCIRRVCRDGLAACPQPAAGVTVARKLRKEQGRVDWRRDSGALERQVRAFFPWPGSWFDLPALRGTKRIAVTTAARVDALPGEGVAGQVVQADQHGWVVACGSGGLRLERLTPEGRGDMTAAEFLRGCPVRVGTRLPVEPT